MRVANNFPSVDSATSGNECDFQSHVSGADTLVSSWLDSPPQIHVTGLPKPRKT